MGVEQFLAFVSESSDPALLGAAFLVCLLALVGDLFEDEGLDLLEPVGGGLNCLVVVFDEGFDVVDEYSVRGVGRRLGMCRRKKRRIEPRHRRSFVTSNTQAFDRRIDRLLREGALNI